MDLVSVIAACAMGFDAHVMHALVWNESRGASWSFRTEGVGEPRVFRTRAEAVREAHRARAGSMSLRIGLTGLLLAPERSDSQAISDALDPCANVMAAARRLLSLQERCSKELRFGPETMRCTLALWRGSLTGQGAEFARTVQADAAAGRLPNFDLDERAEPSEPPHPSATTNRPTRAPDASQVDGSPHDGALLRKDGETVPSENERARRAPLFVQPSGAQSSGERPADKPPSSVSTHKGREDRATASEVLFPARPQAAKTTEAPSPQPPPDSAPGAADPPSASTELTRPADIKPLSGTVFVPATRDRGQP